MPEIAKQPESAQSIPLVKDSGIESASAFESQKPPELFQLVLGKLRQFAYQSHLATGPVLP
jgi:hypothetical protein